MQIDFVYLKMLQKSLEMFDRLVKNPKCRRKKQPIFLIE